MIRTIPSSLLFLFITLCSSISWSQGELFWRTTNGVSHHSFDLNVNKHKYTISTYATYIDVEEDIELSASLDNKPWDIDTKSLEIAGKFSLPKGATLVGVLLWNDLNGTIIKGKLKPSALADAEYEKVVDRNTHDRIIRDPVVIHKLKQDSYSIKIYPVQGEEPRRLRLHYYVPLRTGSVQWKLNSYIGANTSSQNTSNDYNKSKPSPYYSVALNQVVLKSGMQGTDSVHAVIDNENTIKLTSFSQFIGKGVQTLQIVKNKRNAPYAFTTHNTQSTIPVQNGYYIDLYTPIPSDILQNIDFSTYKGIVAEISAGSDTYSDTLFCSTQFCEPWHFKGKSSFIWNTTIQWKLLNSTGVYYQSTQTINPVENTQFSSAQSTLWANSPKPFGAGKDDPLGAQYGFVDNKMSLVALEEDALSSSDANKWANKGVPPLTPSDITYPTSTSSNDRSNYDPTLDIASGGNDFWPEFGSVNLATTQQLQVHFENISLPLQTISLTKSIAIGETITLILYDLKGVVLAKKTIIYRGNNIVWDLSQNLHNKKGVYLFQISQHTQVMAQHKVYLK